jgi:poly(3-hydroxyalkanoate) synthetase
MILIDDILVILNILYYSDLSRIMCFDKISERTIDMLLALIKIHFTYFLVLTLARHNLSVRWLAKERTRVYNFSLIECERDNKNETDCKWNVKYNFENNSNVQFLTFSPRLNNRERK